MATGALSQYLTRQISHQTPGQDGNAPGIDLDQSVGGLQMRQEFFQQEFVNFIRAFLANSVFTFAEDPAVVGTAGQPIGAYKTVGSATRWVQAFISLEDCECSSLGETFIVIRGGDLLSLTRGCSVAIQVDRKSLSLTADDIEELLAIHWSKDRYDPAEFERFELRVDSIDDFLGVLCAHLSNRPEVEFARIYNAQVANDFILVELIVPIIFAKKELKFALQALRASGATADRLAPCKVALIVREPEPPEAVPKAALNEFYRRSATKT